MDHFILTYFFWFYGIGELEKSIRNISILVQQSWEVTASIIEEQQAIIDSLADIVF